MPKLPAFLLAWIAAAQAAVLASQRPKTIKRLVRKVGRNDPCHCGSGRKYKKCCLSEDQKDPEKFPYVLD